ncbi:NHLP bacteriocin system secretion protein [uncultured Thiohalocapsa sp.]|uniref:NHLP bacteriocin system secretion protein n=1 Tax=uncultured Thiohalocapsa sp. TaxID=768990 RepID=UPI0025EF99FE|nr:NHLP bacteriocin system secretion protein [uncultured Thiohalocapsa sp.]
MQQLFRTKALAKVSNPDQLDQALQIIRPAHWLGFGFVLIVVLSALTWSAIATAPVKVSGPGVLLSAGGVMGVTTEGSGRLTQWLVQVGDRVTAGQQIALLQDLQRLADVERAEAAAREARTMYEMLEKEFAIQNQAADDLKNRTTLATEERINSLQALGATLRRRQDGEARLFKEGMVSGVELYDTETRLADIDNEIASARNRLAQLEIDQQRERDQRNDQLADQRIKMRTLEREAKDKRQADARQRVVTADAAGTIATLNMDIGNLAQPGQQVATLIVENADTTNLDAFNYMPAADGKKIEVGMEAQVSPSTVKPELDGYLVGVVKRVSPLPENRASLMRRLGNEVLVNQLLQGGAPIEVQIDLQPDSKTPSGYAWTSGDGPNLQLQPGTMAQSAVVVDRIHLISLLLPAMQYVYGWLGHR